MRFKNRLCPVFGAKINFLKLFEFSHLNFLEDLLGLPRQEQVQVFFLGGGRKTNSINFTPFSLTLSRSIIIIIRDRAEQRHSREGGGGKSQIVCH